MKLPAHLYLEAQDIPYERRSFPPETEKGAASVARVLRISERQAVKTLIFQADTSADTLTLSSRQMPNKSKKSMNRPVL